MNRASLMARIADLSEPVHVATDTGTHGRPDRVEVYQRLDGALFERRGFGGANLRDPDAVASLDDVATPGRLRTIAHASPSARLAEIHALLRQIRALGA